MLTDAIRVRQIGASVWLFSSTCWDFSASFMLSNDESVKSKAKSPVNEDADAFRRVVKLIGDGRRVLVIGSVTELPSLLSQRHCRVSTADDIKMNSSDAYDVVVFTSLSEIGSPIASVEEARRILTPSGFVLGMAVNAMHCANRLALLGANPAIVPLSSALPRARMVEIFEAGGYNVDSVDHTTHAIAEPSPLLPAIDLTEYSAELIDALLGGKDSEILSFIVKATPIATALPARLPAGEPDTVVTLKRELGEQRQALEKAMSSIDALSGKLGSLFTQLDATPEQRVITLDRFRAPLDAADAEKLTLVESQLRSALQRESELIASRDELVNDLAESRAALSEDRRTVERLEAQLRSTDGTLHELRAELKILGRLNAESERAVGALRDENQRLREGSETTKALITSLIDAIGSLEEEVTARNAHVVGTYRAQHNAVQQQLSEIYASPFWAIKMVFVSVGKLFHGS